MTGNLLASRCKRRHQPGRFAKFQRDEDCSKVNPDSSRCFGLSSWHKHDWSQEKCWATHICHGAGHYPLLMESRTPAVPFKAKAACRRHIPKQRHRVTNWAEYDAALRARGSLTIWFTPEATAAWRAEPRTTRGGQPCYSDLAITTALTLRAVFHLALRQTEGLIGSVLQLLGLDLPVPDHSTLSRRPRRWRCRGRR